MSHSYQFSQEHSLQTVLWSIGSALYSAGCLVATLAAWLLAVLPCVGLAVVVGAGFAAVFALFPLVPVTFWLGLVVMVTVAYVTYPSKAVCNG